MVRDPARPARVRAGQPRRGPIRVDRSEVRHLDRELPVTTQSESLDPDNALLRSGRMILRGEELLRQAEAMRDRAWRLLWAAAGLAIVAALGLLYTFTRLAC